MRKNRISSFGLIIFFAIFMVAGCQPGQTRAAEQKVESVLQPQPSHQQKSAPIPSEEKTSDAIAGSVDATPSPKIVMLKAVHDFGEIGPGSIHVADYEFKNTGDAELLVSNIQSTCGCSKPTLIKDGERIPMPIRTPVPFEPGQTGRVEVTFKAGSIRGRVEKHLYVVSNDPQTPRTEFSVKAEVVLKVSVKPESVDLKLDRENAGMPDLVIKSSDGQEFSIKSVNGSMDSIDIPFDPNAMATEFVLKPDVDTGKLDSGIIQIHTTHPQAGTLLVRYNIVPWFELINPRYILQNIEPGKSILRDNTIRSNYGKLVEIESVESRNGYMDIESQEHDGPHLKLTIKITPPEKSEISRRYITDELTITLKDGNKLAIRCSGWFRLE